MAEEGTQPQRGGGGEAAPDRLRLAVERTLAATAGSAAETRERAQDLLDEVARRGQGAREDIGRLVRVATGEELRQLRERIDELEQRLLRLEQAGPASPPSRAEGTE